MKSARSEVQAKKEAKLSFGNGRKDISDWQPLNQREKPGLVENSSLLQTHENARPFPAGAKAALGAGAFLGLAEVHTFS